jgi:amino-acid N-acetyltransferase
MLRVNAGRADIRPAAPADGDAIRALLASCCLPASDLETSRPALVVATVDGILAGLGGVERHGATGLLRSVAVRPDRRGSGLGRELVAHLERQARADGLRALVLLTETAAGFFERLGYRVIERARAPAAVQSSEEFRSLCPQSAVCMVKPLAGDG